MLRKQQWVALVLLTVGVGLVQLYEAGGAAAAGAAAAGGLASGSLISGAVAIGVAAVLASSLLSGFANVYFEKVVKTRPSVSIWMRNVQLGLFSLPQAWALMAADATIIADQGALVGFNLLAWSVVVLKALGGLLVAAVVKCARAPPRAPLRAPLPSRARGRQRSHGTCPVPRAPRLTRALLALLRACADADNVLKTYATAIAIVLTCVVSCLYSWSAPTLGFLQGMAMVIASIFLYNLGGESKKSAPAVAPPPTDEAPDEGAD